MLKPSSTFAATVSIASAAVIAASFMYAYVRGAVEINDTLFHKSGLSYATESDPLAVYCECVARGGARGNCSSLVWRDYRVELAELECPVPAPRRNPFKASP